MSIYQDKVNGATYLQITTGKLTVILSVSLFRFDLQVSHEFALRIERLCVDSKEHSRSCREVLIAIGFCDENLVPN